MLKQVMLVVRPLKVGARKLIIPGNGMTIYIYMIRTLTLNPCVLDIYSGELGFNWYNIYI
jgi:hypothetical protein